MTRQARRRAPSEGTIGALFLSPASRAAVIAGYGLGSFLWLAPSFAVVLALALDTGARLQVADPAAAAAVVALLLASLTTGFACAGLFVLSRRGNLLANFLQLPIYLLAGFLVPRDRLPGWLRPVSDAIPAGHAVDALRAALLNGASLHGILGDLTATLGLAALYQLAESRICSQARQYPRSLSAQPPEPHRPRGPRHEP